jgi:serine protease Do
MLPEDMIADEREMLEIQQSQEGESNPTNVYIEPSDERIRNIVSEMLENNNVGIDEFISMSQALLAITKEAQKSLVTVTGLTSDISWINTVVENRDQRTGIIVGITGREILILANIRSITNADNIILTFVDGKQYPATIKEYDDVTGLAALALRRTLVDQSTLQAIKVIDLGNSSSGVVIGTPVIAVGRVLASADSVSYGYITSASGTLNLVDASYKLLTTDIYSSTSASGVLLNMQGQVIGIMDGSYNTADARNVLSAIGISELKKLIETMCNGISKPYVGIIGMDVTQEAHDSLGVPKGVYITSVLLYTPAMAAGIQSGDIIVKVGETDIASFYGFVLALFRYQAGDTVVLTVMRQGADGYWEIEAEVETR